MTTMIADNEVLARMTQAMGEPSTWVARCHAASLALVEILGSETATVRRGYFIGETKPGAFFHGRPSQHSWVELRDGRVADPTRFAFVGGPEWPIWIGPDDEYDVGGCKLAGSAGSPPELLESGRPPVELNLGSVDYVAYLLGTEPEYRSEDPDDPWIMASVEQLAWLANLPVKNREEPGVLAHWFAAEVYEAIVDAGYSALIPIDRRDWILPERSEGRSSF